MEKAILHPHLKFTQGKWLVYHSIGDSVYSIPVVFAQDVREALKRYFRYMQGFNIYEGG